MEYWGVLKDSQGIVVRATSPQPLHGPSFLGVGLTVVFLSVRTLMLRVAISLPIVTHRTQVITQVILTSKFQDHNNKTLLKIWEV